MRLENKPGKWLRRQLREFSRDLVAAGLTFLVSAVVTYSFWIFVLGLITLLVPPCLLRLLDHLSITATIRSSLWQTMSSSVPKYLRGLVEQYKVYAYGSVLELRSHPELKRGDSGWRLTEFKISRYAREFEPPQHLSPVYRAFVAENQDEPERLQQDKRKVSIARVPAVFTDAPSPTLNYVWTTYSMMRFYQVRFGEQIEARNAVDSVTKFQLGKEERLKKLQQFAAEALEAESDVSFPSSLSLHCLIVTSDDKLVIARRAPHVTYYPNVWVVTTDENIDVVDTTRDSNFLRACIERGLREELVGHEWIIESEELFDIERIRVLCFFLEGSLPAIGLCVYVPLRITFKQLTTLLPHRSDSEAVDWKDVPAAGLKWDKLKEYGDWAVPTHFLLMMLKLYRGEDPQEVLPKLAPI